DRDDQRKTGEPPVIITIRAMRRPGGAWICSGIPIEDQVGKSPGDALEAAFAAAGVTVALQVSQP
ncbi:MAG: hypothetical protein J4N63_01760, partial [Chloroflexi bacterium]|nr:hypothetical protein [Chloroflexota bacterium]